MGSSTREKRSNKNHNWIEKLLVAPVSNISHPDLHSSYISEIVELKKSNLNKLLANFLEIPRGILDEKNFLKIKSK